MEFSDRGSSGNTSKDAEGAAATPRPTENDTSTQTLPPFGQQRHPDAEFAAAFNSATKESGLKFSGDWRTALRELRELIVLTRDFIIDDTSPSNNESNDNELEAQSQTSSNDTLETTTESIESSAPNSASSKGQSDAASFKTPSRDAISAGSASVSRIPVSPRSLQHIDQQATISESANEDEDAEGSNQTSMVTSHPLGGDSLEEGWNEVPEEDENEDYEAPAEDEESVVV